MTKLQINLDGENIIKITDVKEPIPGKMYVVTVETKSKYVDGITYGSHWSDDFNGPCVFFNDGGMWQHMTLSLEGGWTIKSVALKYEYAIIFISDELVYEGDRVDETDVDIVEWSYG